MDKRWEELDNPAATAQRQEILALTPVRPDPIWPGPEGTTEQWKARHEYDRVCHVQTQARQEQEVVDKRAVIEQFAQMLKDHKARGEEIELFAQNNDIPGFCGWDGIENWTHRDPTDVALQWAASDHSC